MIRAGWLVVMMAVWAPAPAGAQVATEPDAAAGTSAATPDAGESAPVQTPTPIADTSPQPTAEPTPETIPVATAPEEVAPEESREASVTQIEEIIVTATKREKPVRDIPATIAVLHGDDLERTGAQGIDEFLKLVPGVTNMDDAGGQRRITIRGIAADAGTNATAGILIGDIPFTDPFLPRLAPDPNPFDLQDVEVLKGPQGTLFGASALNGAIRYVVQPAVLGEWKAKAFYLSEEVDDGGKGETYGAAINLPIGDTLALRVVGHERDSPGWIDETQRGEKDINQIEQTGERALMTWAPGERWKITGMAMVQDSLLKDLATVNNFEGRPERSSTPRPGPVRNHYDLQSLNVEYAFERFALTSLSSRTDKQVDAFIEGTATVVGGLPPPLPGLLAGVPLLGIELDNRNEGALQEFRLTSNPGAYEGFEWLVGWADYRGTLRENIDLTVTALQLPPAVTGLVSGLLDMLLPGLGTLFTPDGSISALNNRPDIEVEEQAFFGEATKTFWDDLDVTLGLRYYKTRSGGTVTAKGPITPISTLPTFLSTFNSADLTATTVVDAEIEERGTNPKLSLLYRFNPDVSIYGTVARGFRFGGIQTTPSLPQAEIPPTYKSDTITSYELGLRTQWLDNTLTFDPTLFYIDWKEPQIGQQTPDGLFSFQDNVGGAKSHGAELALRYLTPIEGLSLTLAAAWVETVTTEPFTTASGANIEPGSPWPLTAKRQTATTLAYETSFGATLAGAALVHTYSSKAFNNLEQDLEVFGFGTYDLQLHATHLAWAAHPQISLSLNNLTDVRELVGGNVGAGVSGLPVGTTPVLSFNRPRSLVLRLAVEF